MAERLYFGIDLGGTKIAAGLVNGKGKLLRSASAPTFPGENQKANVATLTTQIANLALSLISEKEKKSLVALGIASAGPLDVEKGVLLNPTHFPGWKRVPLVSSLKKSFAKRGVKIPVHFQNDAIAAALGEGWVGAAKSLQTYAVITVGTGIGSGVIYRGQPAQFGGMGSEWGLGILSLDSIRTTQDAWKGSTEAFASGTGILLRAKELGFQGENLRNLGQAIPANPKYQSLFDDAALALAILSHNLSLGFHPQAILFTGGVMNLKEHFFPQLKDYYNKLMQKNLLFKAPIKLASLGNTAGMLGAASLARLASAKN